MTTPYALALYAENQKKYQIAAAYTLSKSEEDARLAGMDSALKYWPLADGWYNHHCSVYKVPQDQSLGATQVGRDIFSQDIRLLLPQSLERLSNADPSKVQEIVASQIELLTLYHNVVLDQAKRSFVWAVLAAGAGLVFFLAAIGFILIQQSPNVALISLISGALVEVISGINFYLYNRSSGQLADFQTRLDMTQRYLLANSVCDSLEGDAKQQTRSSLVQAIAGIVPTKVSNTPNPTQ